MKKLLIIGNGSFGKINKKVLINQHTGKLLLDLKKNGINPTMLQCSSSYFINKNDNLLDFDLVSNKINFIDIVRNSKNIILYFKNILIIFRALLNFKYIYIFSPGTLGLLVGFLGIMFNKKIGLYVRGEFIEKKKFYNFLSKKSNFILTVSPMLKQMVNNKNISIIKPMINLNIKSKIYKPYSPKNKIRILFVGRLEKRKGIMDLIDMVSILDLNQISYTVDIVGGGDLYNELLLNQKRGNISHDIKFHGLISDREKLDSFYNDADLFYFPSHDEGFPRVLYEAMAHSLPIFTTFVGGIPGYMINAQNCIKIPVRDGMGSSKILISHLEKKDIMCKLSKNAFSMVQNIFNGNLLDQHILINNKFYNE